jgi:hypothetical protein
MVDYLSEAQTKARESKEQKNKLGVCKCRGSMTANNSNLQNGNGRSLGGRCSGMQQLQQCRTGQDGEDDESGPRFSFGAWTKSDKSDWTCPACTFLNKALFLACEVCGQTRPTLDPPPSGEAATAATRGWDEEEKEDPHLASLRREREKEVLALQRQILEESSQRLQESSQRLEHDYSHLDQEEREMRNNIATAASAQRGNTSAYYDYSHLDREYRETRSGLAAAAAAAANSLHFASAHSKDYDRLDQEGEMRKIIAMAAATTANNASKRPSAHNDYNQLGPEEREKRKSIARAAATTAITSKRAASPATTPSSPLRGRKTDVTTPPSRRSPRRSPFSRPKSRRSPRQSPTNNTKKAFSLSPTKTPSSSYNNDEDLFCVSSQEDAEMRKILAMRAARTSPNKNTDSAPPEKKASPGGRKTPPNNYYSPASSPRRTAGGVLHSSGTELDEATLAKVAAMSTSENRSSNEGATSNGFHPRGAAAVEEEILPGAYQKKPGAPAVRNKAFVRGDQSKSPSPKGKGMQP